MALLKLIQTEFLKLRRRKLIWLMLLSALIMPFFALLYFNYFGKTGVVLGILCTMLMYEENQYDMLKQLWIVPISKIGYFFSKFFVVLIYSICFMLTTAVASVLFSVLSGYVVFNWGSILYLLKKCLEIGVITAFVMLPILAIAASQKGYILPVCITLIYVFSGFALMTINMYLHPLSSMGVVIIRNKDIPGITFSQEINVPLAFLCICIWSIVSLLFANIALGKRK